MKKRLLALLMTMTMGLTACSGAADTSAAGDSASGSAAGASTAGTSAASTTSPQSAAAPEADNIDLSAYKVYFKFLSESKRVPYPTPRNVHI